MSSLVRCEADDGRCRALRVVRAVGLYSVIAYGVAQRTHEIGVRIALGAAGRDVIGLIVGEGARVATPGIVIGVAASLFAGRWIAPLLYQVSPRDPMTFAGIVAVLLLVALVASLLPALRAARVDPNVALRADQAAPHARRGLPTPGPRPRAASARGRRR